MKNHNSSMSNLNSYNQLSQNRFQRQSSQISVYPKRDLTKNYLDEKENHHGNKQRVGTPILKNSLQSTEGIPDPSKFVLLSKLMREQRPLIKPSETINIYSRSIDPLSPYLISILGHLWQNQNSNKVSKSCLSHQTEVNKRMRAVLLNWLIQVHQKFKLLQRTLFSMVNLLDRFLERKVVPRTHLQLLGLTCLFIASKYEDIYPPELKDLAEITNNSITKEMITECEQEVFLTLGFDMVVVSSHEALDALLKRWNIGSKPKRDLARMVLVLFLFHHYHDKFKPFRLASFAYLVACRFYHDVENTEVWNFVNNMDSKYLWRKCQRLIKQQQVESLQGMEESFGILFEKLASVNLI